MTSDRRIPPASWLGRAGPLGLVRSLLAGILLAGVLAAPGGLPSVARAGDRVRAHEYELKAVFLQKITRFVDWGTEAAVDRPFVVGVLGDDPFGDALEEAFRAGPAHGRSVVVRHFPDADDLEPCQLLFVGRSEADDLCGILRRIEGEPTLTVSDIPDFSALGGIMTLRMADSRVRLEINPGAQERSGLRINSNLLRLAKEIEERECE